MRQFAFADAVTARNLPYASGVAGTLDQLIDSGGTGLNNTSITLSGLGSTNDVADAAAQMVPTL